MGVFVLVIASARSDSAAPQASPSDPGADGNPILGTPVMPAPGWESPPRDLSQPYPIGPAADDHSPKPFWSYDDASSDEKLHLDHERNTTRFTAAAAALAASAAENAANAEARAAARQLGYGDLANLGVVP